MTLARNRLVFVAATNNPDVLRTNLLRSQLFKEEKYPLVLQSGYTNISRAYNDAWRNIDADFVVFLHQDVFIPAGWDDLFFGAVEILSERERKWAVVGVAGVNLLGDSVEYFGHLQENGREWRGGLELLPVAVETLDELLLVCKGNLGFRFDERIPTAHFYGADLCLQAGEEGYTCHVINAYVHHNTTGGANTDAFRQAEDYMRKKWKRRLPFATTCVVVRKRLLRHRVHQVLIDYGFLRGK
jgi:hypothetical protein